MPRLALLLLLAPLISAFHLPALSLRSPRRAAPPVAQAGNQFDVSSQQLDLLSLRTFRRDAILQYDATNQSEPLRIALTFLGVLFFLCLPQLSPGSEADLVTNAGSALGAGASGWLFLRNRAARSARLERISREYAIGDLKAVYRGVRANRMSELRGKRRVVVLLGTSAELQTTLREAWVYRRRLAAASTAVVPVCSDDDSFGATNAAASPPWLWAAAPPSEWNTYFEEQFASRGMAAGGGGGGAWLALNLKGRSAGSALGAPRWDELLGTCLQPSDKFGFAPAEQATDVSAAATEAAEAVLALGVASGGGGSGGGSGGEGAEAEASSVLATQATFYAALTGGDGEAMAQLTEGAPDDASVSDALAAGGRLDPWSNQLRDGMRPEGMRATDRDAIVLSDTEAWSTAVERPAEGGTLLATQRWRRDADGGEWRLATHRTIPWDADGGTAIVTLRCDGRGCVALGREINTREKLSSGGAVDLVALLK